MFIDTHAHLNFKDYNNDLDDVLRRALESGVSHIVNIGIDYASSLKSVELADKYDNIFAAVGIHPHNASLDDIQKQFIDIRNLLSNKNIIALGEVGLDYYRNDAMREDQIKLFKQFVALSREVDLPLIIHARDSYGDLFDILEKDFEGNIKGVLHCFTAGKNELRKALDIGLYISFTGIITFKNCDDLRETLKYVPDDRLLLETDCPFLAPQTFRGKRNEPSYLIDIAKKVAEVRNVSIEDIALITKVNFAKFFNKQEFLEKPAIVYKIRNSIYINTTYSCTNKCSFCVKFYDDYVKGYNLKIENDPSVTKVLKLIKRYSDYKEVVFCGLGEPTLRLDFIKQVASYLKKDKVYIRINTNGQANLIYKRNILPELQGLVDEISVSLNFQNADLYNKYCKPSLSGDVYGGILNFIAEAKKYIPSVVVTALDLPEVDIEKVKKIADDFGVAYRQRYYKEVG